MKLMKEIESLKDLDRQRHRIQSQSELKATSQRKSFLRSNKDIFKKENSQRNSIIGSINTTFKGLSDYSNYGTNRSTQKRTNNIASQRNLSPWSTKNLSAERSQKMELETRKYINQQKKEMDARKKSQKSSQIQSMKFIESNVYWVSVRDIFGKFHWFDCYSNMLNIYDTQIIFWQKGGNKSNILFHAAILQSCLLKVCFCLFIFRSQKNDSAKI